jgi:hypothetical protein
LISGIYNNAILCGCPSKVLFGSDHGGKYIGQWGDLDRPADIYIDANETVYVSDLKPSVIIMDKKGNQIARWESPNGHGLWADSRGNIYLADVPGHAIHKYRRRSA